MWPSVLARGSNVPDGVTRRRASHALLVSAGLGAAAVLGASVVTAPWFIAAAVTFLLTGMALVCLVRLLTAQAPSSRPNVMAWTLGGFTVHVALGLLVWSNAGLTQTLGGDAITYHGGAVQLADHWLNGAISPTLPAGKAGFYYLLAVTYWLFGVHPAAALILNGAMAAAVIPVMLDATRRLYGEAAARVVPAMATLIPGFMLWGSQLLREAGAYLLIALCLNCATRLRTKTSLSTVAVFVISATLLVAWRADVGVVVALGLVVGLILARPSGGAVTGTSILGLVLIIIVVGGLGYSGYHLVLHSGLSTLNGVRADSSASAASGFLPNADVSTPRHALSYLPIGVTYFLLGPFPWQIHGGRQLLGMPDTLAWWILLPSLWRGLRLTHVSRRAVWLAATPSVALILVLSLLVANFGTTVRERMQVILLLLPIVALGWSHRKDGDRQHRSVAPK